MSTETKETGYYEKLENTVETLNEELDELRDELNNSKLKVQELETINNQLNEESEENSISTDDPEDCRRSLFFALNELEEVERGEVSLTDKLFDLRMRHCRFL